MSVCGSIRKEKKITLNHNEKGALPKTASAKRKRVFRPPHSLLAGNQLVAGGRKGACPRSAASVKKKGKEREKEIPRSWEVQRPTEGGKKKYLPWGSLILKKKGP